MLFFSHPFFLSADIFQIILSMSNSLNPDQAQCSSGPDLGPNCKDHRQTRKFATGMQSVNSNAHEMAKTTCIEF